MRKVKIFIAQSIDGYIARPDGNLDWLGIVHQEGEDYGYEKFVSGIDTVVMGRKTYDIVLELAGNFPHADKNCYIITRSRKESEGSINFYNGSASSLILEIKMQSGGDIFVDGGSEIILDLLKNDLIDEYIISTIPILLGDGIPLFAAGFESIRLKLLSNLHFTSGMVQSHYIRSDSAEN